MSCNTKTSLAVVIDAVNAQLNNNYVDRDDPRINQGVFTEPTIRGGLMLDEAAKLDFCGFVQECGIQAPFGKQWIDRPLYPGRVLTSYDDAGEVNSRWEDPDDAFKLVSGTTWQVGTVEDLKKIEGAKLGQRATTENFHAGIAGGGAEYKWVGEAKDNGINLHNGWELVLHFNMDIRQFGVIMDSPLVQTSITRKLPKLLSDNGGGVLTIPSGTLLAGFDLSDNVSIKGAIGEDKLPSTVLKAWARVVGHDSNLLNIAAKNVNIHNLKLDGLFEGKVGQCTGIRTSGTNIEIHNCVSEGSRYDGISVVDGGNVRVYDSSFTNNGRNQVTVSAGADVTFVRCGIKEDSTLYPALYMVDIEPNGATSIWHKVKFYQCTFNKVTQTLNAAINIGQWDSNEALKLYDDIEFTQCEFKGFSDLTPRHTTLHGLRLYNNTFEGIAFSIRGTLLVDVKNSTIHGNTFNGSGVFSYGIFFDETVEWTDNHFEGAKGSIDASGYYKSPRRFRNTATNPSDKYPLNSPLDATNKISPDGYVTKVSAIAHAQLIRLAVKVVTVPARSRGILRIRNILDRPGQSPAILWGAYGRNTNIDIHFDATTSPAKYFIDARLNQDDEAQVNTGGDFLGTGVEGQIAIKHRSTAQGAYVLELEVYRGGAEKDVLDAMTDIPSVALGGRAYVNEVPLVMGSTANRPTKVWAGYQYLDTQANKLLIYTGTGWVDVYNNDAAYVAPTTAKSGTTAQRPEGVSVGYQFFDTTLGYPVYYKSEGIWVDATGATV